MIHLVPSFRVPSLFVLLLTNRPARLPACPPARLPACLPAFLLCLPDGPASTALTYIAHALDALLFCFLPLVFALLLRIVTGRDLLARLGKRTLVRVER